MLLISRNLFKSCQWGLNHWKCRACQLLLVALLAPSTYAIKGSHLTSLMCDLLMLLVMRYNRTEKLDFCKKPKVGCDVTDVTCDKVTEKSMSFDVHKK